MPDIRFRWGGCQSCVTGGSVSVRPSPPRGAEPHAGDLARVAGLLVEWLRDPRDDELKRAFADWMRQMAEGFVPDDAARAEGKLEGLIEGLRNPEMRVSVAEHRAPGRSRTLRRIHPAQRVHKVYSTRPPSYASAPGPTRRCGRNASATGAAAAVHTATTTALSVRSTASPSTPAMSGAAALAAVVTV